MITLMNWEKCPERRDCSSLCTLTDFCLSLSLLKNVNCCKTLKCLTLSNVCGEIQKNFTFFLVFLLCYFNCLQWQCMCVKTIQSVIKETLQIMNEGEKFLNQLNNFIYNTWWLCAKISFALKSVKLAFFLKSKILLSCRLKIYASINGL